MLKEEFQEWLDLPATRSIIKHLEQVREASKERTVSASYPSTERAGAELLFAAGFCQALAGIIDLSYEDFNQTSEE